MCVDDYQFKHYSARRQKICRKFIIVNEQQDFAKTFFVNISQFQQNGEVALCKIIIHLSTKGLLIDNKKFYLPKFNAIIQPYSYCKIIFQALNQQEIFLKSYSIHKETSQIFEQNQNMDIQYNETMGQSNQQNYYCRFQQIDEEQLIQTIKYIQPNIKKEDQRYQTSQIQHQSIQIDHQISENSSKNQEKEQNKQRIKECQRGIEQVIRAVKTWRQLYQNNKCNLTQASKVVGISKKSLDDYYLVLRIGQILKFDYKNNMNKKMGDLRYYIKSKQQKVTGKLGKNVQCFKLIQELDLDQIMKRYNQTKID